jgi:hypothetical protein
MTIWSTTSDAANNSSIPVLKTRTATITLPVSGLKPRSGYTVWVDGVDVTWACRTPGSRMGSGITTDDYGSATILYMTEIKEGETTSGTVQTKAHAVEIRDVGGTTRVTTVLRQDLFGRQ